MAAGKKAQPGTRSAARRERNTKGSRRMGAAAVAEYFAKLEPGKRAGLERFRRTLKALLPKAEECISYGIPAFRHADGVVAYYAAMKAHLSFFPTSYPIEVCAEDLKGYETSRGTIRFPVDEPLPAGLVKKLVTVRLGQMAEDAGRRKGGGKGGKREARKAAPKRGINAAWHAEHPMPKNAKLPERAAWHLAHRDQCGCREMPASVAAYLREAKRPARRKDRG